MSVAPEEFVCPHCESKLLAFELPESAGWDERHHFACFNDDCPYYKKGWDWMMSQYEAKASYRYRVDPSTGCASPIAVWSDSALRDRILEAQPAPPAGPKEQ